MKLQDLLKGHKVRNIETKCIGVNDAVSVTVEHLMDVLSTMSQSKLYSYETIVARDTTADIEITYILCQHIQESGLYRVAVRTSIERYAPKLPSIMHLWLAAQTDEYEITELLGIDVVGLEPIQSRLLPEGWVGYPLRKDYVFPENFEGIEHRRLPLRKEHRRP